MKINQQLKIETERLVITPITTNFASKILNDDITAYDELGINQIDEWPNQEIREILPIIRNKLSLQPNPDGFEAWLFIDKSENIIIGDGGFKGAPDKNCKIDIGYGVISSKRRQGYAFEAVTALLKWGFSQDNVKAITADCQKNNTTSRKLLLKVGMSEIKQDDELVYFEINSYER